MQHELQVLLRSIDFITKSFRKPDDDWTPILYALSNTDLLVVPLLVENDTKKQRLLSIALLPLLKTMEPPPYFVAIVWPAWHMTLPKKDLLTPLTLEMLDHYGIEHHPQRQEAVMVITVDNDGKQCLLAKVSRFKDKPPTLSPWEPISEGIARDRVGDALESAFREIHHGND